MVGAGAEGWKVGQRVGMGFLGGSCGQCGPCRGGDLVNCRNQKITGVHYDGGYAEVMIAKANGLMSVPDDLSSVDAAPLLCAGLTTFSALRNAPAKAGDLVAVLGIGGLGHLGLQYARHMGFEVAAVGRGADKAGLVRKLGAHHYIDNSVGSSADALLALGGAAVVLVTSSSGGRTVSDTVKGLRPGGVAIVLGAGPEPIEVMATDLLSGGRKIEGALTGTPGTGDATLKFSVRNGVTPMIETMPLERAPEAYAKMMTGKGTVQDGSHYGVRTRSDNSKARRDHERRSSTTTGKFDGWLHVRRCPLHRCRKASCYRPLPLQPLPAAIRKRLLDSDLRTSQRGDDHR